MRFEFATATRIVFGPGTVRGIGEIARNYGSRALIVTGRSSDRAQPILEALQSARLSWVLYPVAGEPDTVTVEHGVSVAKKDGCDLVISLGGGSAIDAGKAIAAMLTNEGELLDYLEVIGHGKSLGRAPAPFIAVPTTAGTGSEVTRNAVLASAEHRVKVSLRSALMLPQVALVDPELTYNLPPNLTATTGLDALTQVIEPYVCTRRNFMTDALCLEGIRLAGRSLRAACENGKDPHAREEMSAASLFGGLALANAGLGAVHGFAGPVGGMFPAPHGAICAALLPRVMGANLRALRAREPQSEVIGRYETVARLLTGKLAASAEDGVEWVRAMVTALGIPSLRSYGITEIDASDLIAKAEKASSMKANPITLTRGELAEILAQSM